MEVDEVFLVVGDAGLRPKDLEDDIQDEGQVDEEDMLEEVRESVQEDDLDIHEEAQEEKAGRDNSFLSKNHYTTRLGNTS